MDHTDSFAASEVTTPVLDYASLGIEVADFFVGDGYAKVFKMPAGRIIGQHKHRRYHMSTLLLGSVTLEVAGVRRNLHAPCTVRLEAGVEHIITAVTDALWVCQWDNLMRADTPEAFEKGVAA